MNVRQMYAFLANPQRVGDTYCGEGWRRDVPSQYAPLYDETLAAGLDAMKAALTGPDGWAFRLLAWTRTQQGELTYTVSGLRGQAQGYYSLTAAATAYMVIALESKMWTADREDRTRERPGPEADEGRSDDARLSGDGPPDGAQTRPGRKRPSAHAA